jgi:ABC-type sugar transport system ATPase subunit
LVSKVLINGVACGDLGKYSRLTGFVPQEDVMHRNLTVAENLHYAATLRMPWFREPDKLCREVCMHVASMVCSHVASMVCSHVAFMVCIHVAFMVYSHVASMVKTLTPKRIRRPEAFQKTSIRKEIDRTCK